MISNIEDNIEIIKSKDGIQCKKCVSLVYGTVGQMSWFMWVLKRQHILVNLLLQIERNEMYDFTWHIVSISSFNTNNLSP